MKAILVVDTGTSSMRGILFSDSGRQLFSHSVQYSMQLGTDGEATMSATIFKTTLIEIAAACAAHATGAGIEIIGLSFTSQRSSVAAVGRDGTPLSPFIMWYDKRSSPLCAEHTRLHGAELYQICGMVLTPTSSAPKMQWLKNTYPEQYEKSYKLMGIHDYLLLLTSGRFVTDTSLACRTSLMDIRSFCWSTRLIELFELDAEKLCELVKPGSVVGKLVPDFADATGLPCGIPIVSAGGDQQCCTLGQGLYKEGTVNVNTGTASYVSTVLNSPLLDPKMQVNLNASCYGDRWIVEASNTGSGILYQWFNKSFFTLDSNNTSCSEMDEAVLTVPAGCDGLLCVTDFAGRGCPDTNPRCRGMFANIDLNMGRAHFARAVLEGICFDIRESCDYLFQLGIPESAIYSSGGLTKFTEFNKILADSIGKCVYVSRQAEATALGAWIVAGIALGRIDSPDAFFGANPQSNAVEYPANEQHHNLYNRQYCQRLILKSQLSPARIEAQDGRELP